MTFSNCNNNKENMPKRVCMMTNRSSFYRGFQLVLHFVLLYMTIDADQF